mmetsp:Transcript_27128/g.78994  ORF Transcript_27128/g.78994 Transcript_27128/m.78994 type:complete len:293 (+) Transcript_27128:1591-2469(+)
MDSMVCCSRPCIRSTTRMAMSQRLDPRDRRFEKASWPGVSMTSMPGTRRSMPTSPLSLPVFSSSVSPGKKVAPICCVIPPASPSCTLVRRILSRSLVLPVSTWPMMQMMGLRSRSVERSFSRSAKVSSRRRRLSALRRSASRSDLLFSAASRASRRSCSSLFARSSSSRFLRTRDRSRIRFSSSIRSCSARSRSGLSSSAADFTGGRSPSPRSGTSLISQSSARSSQSSAPPSSSSSAAAAGSAAGAGAVSAGSVGVAGSGVPASASSEPSVAEDGDCTCSCCCCWVFFFLP